MGLYVTPRIGTPSSISAIATENSGIPLMNSLVPSSGSTIQPRRHFNRSSLSTVSSESHPYEGNGSRSVFLIALSASRSACVTGLSCPFDPTLSPSRFQYPRRISPASRAAFFASLSSRVKSFSSIVFSSRRNPICTSTPIPSRTVCLAPDREFKMANSVGREESMPKDKFVQVNGLQLHYRDFGLQGQPVLLFMHGLT